MTLIPLISIILPVFNGEKYLSQSIESCLNQSYENIELIIVNDCSIDGTLGVLNHYASIDNRIKIINNDENKKLPASLNIGHKEAKGTYVTWTSDDNFYELTAINDLVKTILDKNVDIVYSDIFIIDHEGKVVREVEFPDFENTIFKNYIGSCFLYKKEVFDKNNGYNEELFLIEDYDFWLKSIVHSQFFHLKKKIYNYRKHGASLTYQIAYDDEKKRLFNKNVIKMYDAFSKIYLEKDYILIRDFLAKSLSYQMIPFDWIKNNELIIDKFKDSLSKNINFKNRKAIEKIFLSKSIELLILDQGSESNFSKSLYIIKKYGLFLDKKSIKTLIKYSFFKK